MDKLWLVANTHSGELSLLATARTVYVGMLLDPVLFDPMLNEFQLFPIDKSFYRILPAQKLFVLMELGELNDGNSRGRHYEAQEALQRVLPEAARVRPPALSEDALELFKEHVVNPEALMGLASSRLAATATVMALRAYFQGMEAAQ